MNETPDKIPWEKVNITKLFYQLRDHEKYIPFWNNEKKEISNDLWYPTGQEKLNTVIGNDGKKKENSWFSIKKKFLPRKNKVKDFLHPEPEENKPSPIKTIKVRIFPNKNQKEELKLIFNQFRWYYNAQVNIFNNFYGDRVLERKKYFFTHERDRMRTYRFEEIDGKKKFIHDPNLNEIPIPSWWNNVHSRIPRGAVKKFIMGVNAAISNFNAGNINKFKMGFLKKKSNTEFFHFEDANYPTFIDKIKSRYSYKTRDHRRTSLRLNQLSLPRKGLEVIHEKSTDRYFIHYPVEKDWFPEDDLRNEKQESKILQKNRLISLDPGIRKFLVGYDPQGKSFFIGNKAKKRLEKIFIEIDDLCSERKLHPDKHAILTVKINEKWKKLKNLITELHWKTVDFLIKNYDTILLPDFRTSQMLKGKKLPRIVKRLMSMFSFYSFKEKLRWKCSLYNKQLIIVNESFTSKTCGLCGELNDIGVKEHFSCKKCKLGIDRDVNGARNILLKNSCLY